MPVEFLYNLRYSKIPLLVSAPGRINLLGEHTDYNQGFVLPAAINKYINVAIGKNEESLIRLYALQFGEYTCQLNDLKPLQAGAWQNYVIGVVDQLQKRGHRVSGFNAVINGDIPMGAGLSSSAAMECAITYALNELFELCLSKFDMIHIAQAAEHEFAGVACGIMDQFASIMGRRNQVIKLDCRDLCHEYVDLNLEGYQLLLLNTNVKHSLAESAYNTRRQECKTGLLWLQEHEPAVLSLREATQTMLSKYVLPRDITVYKRCRYVLEENERVLGACKDLQDGNLFAFGTKMFETHLGLTDLYEVSCKELDFLVELTADHPDVLGARMMGGGFGGCTINLVKESAVEQVIASVSYRYEKEMGKRLSTYTAETVNGAGLTSRPHDVQKQKNDINWN